MEISRHWRIRKQRYAMIGSICQECGAAQFPPRPVCLECSQNNRQPAEALPIILVAAPQPVAAD
jgi:uncharacterized OB-fold protein